MSSSSLEAPPFTLLSQCTGVSERVHSSRNYLGFCHHSGWKSRSSMPCALVETVSPNLCPSRPTSPFQNQPKEQQKCGQIGKMDKGSQVMTMEEPVGVQCDKMVVPLESFHSCQSCCVSELLPTCTGSGAPGLLLS